MKHLIKQVAFRRRGRPHSHVWFYNYLFINQYCIGYNTDVMTVQETEKFKNWIRELKDRIAQAIINARIRRISAGNFGDVKPEALYETG